MRTAWLWFSARIGQMICFWGAAGFFMGVSGDYNEQKTAFALAGGFLLLGGVGLKAIVAVKGD